MEVYPKTTVCRLYQCSKNPFSSDYKQSEDVLVEDYTDIQYYGTRLFVGNHSFDMQPALPQGVFLYISSDDAILKLPRGYKGAYSYYRLVSKK